MRVVVVVMVLLGCGNRARSAPEQTSAPSRLNLGATAVNPEVHVNPEGDAGAVRIQIGNVNTRLPGEGERVPQAAPAAE